MTTYEITLIFEASRAVAEELLHDLSDEVCAATGGVGEGDGHVCGGFVTASVAAFDYAD